jgi:predicted house-cleaning noncanonical NTP pyrophosphatase (MazG superfamily)
MKRATVETRTEWVCPNCDQFGPEFGATNPLSGKEFIYECHHCCCVFKAPEKRKLVRDNIPALMWGDGVEANPRQLGPEELDTALRTKLVEEALEVDEAEPDEILDELADVYEVWKDLCWKHGGVEPVLERAETKRRDKGGFTEGWEVDIP